MQGSGTSNEQHISMNNDEEDEDDGDDDKNDDFRAQIHRPEHDLRYNYTWKTFPQQLWF